MASAPCSRSTACSARRSSRAPRPRRSARTGRCPSARPGAGDRARGRGCRCARRNGWPCHRWQPRVTGWSGSPATRTIWPSRTQASIPQASGQSCGQTERRTCKLDSSRWRNPTQSHCPSRSAAPSSSTGERIAGKRCASRERGPGLRRSRNAPIIAQTSRPPSTAAHGAERAGTACTEATVRHANARGDLCTIEHGGEDEACYEDLPSGRHSCTGGRATLRDRMSGRGRTRARVGQPGIEPGTSVLSGLRSNRLSYWPGGRTGRSDGH